MEPNDNGTTIRFGVNTSPNFSNVDIYGEVKNSGFGVRVQHNLTPKSEDAQNNPTRVEVFGETKIVGANVRVGYNLTPKPENAKETDSIGGFNRGDTVYTFAKKGEDPVSCSYKGTQPPAEGVNPKDNPEQFETCKVVK